MVTVLAVVGSGWAVLFAFALALCRAMARDDAVSASLVRADRGAEPAPAVRVRALSEARRVRSRRFSRPTHQLIRL